MAKLEAIKKVSFYRYGISFWIILRNNDVPFELRFGSVLPVDSGLTKAWIEYQIVLFSGRISWDVHQVSGDYQTRVSPQNHAVFA
jgi:hypothetical protein